MSQNPEGAPTAPASNKHTANCSDQVSQHSGNSPVRASTFVEKQLVWIKMKGHQVWPGFVSADSLSDSVSFADCGRADRGAPPQVHGQLFQPQQACLRAVEGAGGLRRLVRQAH